jgi:glyoxylate reductase
MRHRVGFFLPAPAEVCAIVARHLPPDCDLVVPPRGADLAAAAAELDFLITGKAPAALVHAAPRLRLIQTPGVGYDQIDLAAAAAAGVSVAVCLRGCAECVAEFTLLLMLAVSRRLVELHNALRDGRWLMWERRLVSHNLQGRSLGLVGMGRIGRCVAERAAAFGMRVGYCDRVPVAGYPRWSLPELLANSDIVSLHVPLTPETAGMMGRGQFATMKPGAIFINAARGELVDEDALVEALQSGHLGGAGLDVFAREPLAPDHPLLALPQVVATPHAANGTLEALEEKAALYGENIARVLRGETPEGLVSTT